MFHDVDKFWYYRKLNEQNSTQKTKKSIKQQQNNMK